MLNSKRVHELAEWKFTLATASTGSSSPWLALLKRHESDFIFALMCLCETRVHLEHSIERKRKRNAGYRRDRRQIFTSLSLSLSLKKNDGVTIVAARSDPSPQTRVSTDVFAADRSTKMSNVRHRRATMSEKPEEGSRGRRTTKNEDESFPFLSPCLYLSLSIAVIEVGTKPIGKFQLPMQSTTPLEKPIVPPTAFLVPSTSPPRCHSWRTSFQRRTIIDKSTAAIKITEENGERERETRMTHSVVRNPRMRKIFRHFVDRFLFLSLFSCIRLS